MSLATLRLVSNMMLINSYKMLDKHS